MQLIFPFLPNIVKFSMLIHMHFIHFLKTYPIVEILLKLKLQYFGHLIWMTHLKRPWCWERLKARGEGNDRGWDRWMASPAQWTWVWVDSESWWWTGRPGVLQSMGSQRVGHDWATELTDWLTYPVKGHLDWFNFLLLF